jgi:outer membrane protein assembly factor BamB
LTPLGTLIVGGTKRVKPWPESIDDWPQYLNKADNNAVARDTVAGPPRLVQWVDNPVWCRSHMGIPTVAGMVTSRGRLFTIEDAAPPDNPFLPAAFQIVARDAFNGTRLWARKITRWEAVTMYIKCQPVQQQRRMAVVGDMLYCTLELEGPLSALDAATGDVLKVYKHTSPTQEVAYDQGILYLNVGDRFASSAYNIVKLKGKPFVEGADPSQPFYGGGFREGYAPEIRDKENPVSAILALDPKTGSELWAVRKINNYTAGSLAIKGQYAVYQAADGLFCVNAKTGANIWAHEKQIFNALGHDSHTPGTTPNTVVITDDKLFAVEATSTGRIASNAKNALSVYSLKDGTLLGQTPVGGNYQASSDICFVNGTLWIGGHNPTQLGGRLLAISTSDGKQLAEYSLNAAPVWDSKHLCRNYRALSHGDQERGRVPFAGTARRVLRTKGTRPLAAALRSNSCALVLIAVANGQLYISLADGTVQCRGPSCDLQPRSGDR